MLDLLAAKKMCSAPCTRPAGFRPTQSHCARVSRSSAAWCLTGHTTMRLLGVAERAALHKSMLAYNGKYRIEGDDFITTVDVSWNEIWNGTEQRRHYRIEGDRLFIESAPAPSILYPGKTDFRRIVCGSERNRSVQNRRNLRGLPQASRTPMSLLDPIASVWRCPCYFRFAPENRRLPEGSACLKGAITGSQLIYRSLRRRSSTKHLGFMSKRPARFSSSSSHNITLIAIRSRLFLD